jgi:hypothetical protein
VYIGKYTHRHDALHSPVNDIMISGYGSHGSAAAEVQVCRAVAWH